MSFLWNEQEKEESAAGLPEKRQAAMRMLGKLGVFFTILKIAPFVLDMVLPEAPHEQAKKETPSFVNPALAGLTPSPPSPTQSA